jgi:hypothetical protein
VFPKNKVEMIKFGDIKKNACPGASVLFTVGIFYPYAG